ncbi:hypothetical protein DL96DRAFT_1813082 [Flagelloscypha sp. PMI_526]|nr:hypothetical protein DL96DRAFT_1813082 [Flagelloscypha sp. PMI_526]
MAATSMLEQLFFPGFLEDIILDRVHKVLYEKTKEVEERKNVEIRVCEDRYAVLEEDLNKAKNNIAFLERAHAQAQSKVTAQAQVAQHNTEVFDLFGRLQQRFASQIYPSAHVPAPPTTISAAPFLDPPLPGTASGFDRLGATLGLTASRVVGDSEKPAKTSGLGSLMGWGSSAAPKTTTPKSIIDPTPKPAPERVKTAEYEDPFMPITNKKMVKKEREKMKKDEEKRQKGEAAAIKKREEGDAKAVEGAAANAGATKEAEANAGAAAKQVAGEETKRKADEDSAATAKQGEEKLAEKDGEPGWGLLVSVQKRKKEREIRLQAGGLEASAVTETPTPVSEAAACSTAEGDDFGWSAAPHNAKQGKVREDQRKAEENKKRAEEERRSANMSGFGWERV